MGFSRPSFLGAVAAASITTLIVSGIAFAAPASADQSNPTAVSSDALPTAQVNGVVWTQAVSNGIDYVGGSFDESQPAGAAEGVDVTARGNLFAFNVSTGVAVTFSAKTNAQVRGIAASPDGSRIYIVGDFTTVNGQPRNHIAALTTSGALVSDFAPSVNGHVFAVATRGNTVYFGGKFTAVGGKTRSRVAAVDTSGSLLSFSPSVGDGTVRAIAISPGGDRVLIGGSFTSTNGSRTLGLAAVDTASGATQHWSANGIIYNSGTEAAIYSLSTRGDVVYATGYVHGGLGSGNLEGAVAMNWSDGSVVWIEDCHGDSYSSYPFNDAVYVASHAHDCANVVGGWSSPGTASEWHRAQAFSQGAVGTLAHNSQSGYYDFGGLASPRLVADWSPSINAGTYTGASQGAWSVTGGGSYVVFGGEFTKVNGSRQTGLVRFRGQPESSNNEGSQAPTTDEPASATKPNRVSKPDAVALGPSKVAVKWSAPKAAKADQVSGYRVRIYKGSTLVKTVDVGAGKRRAVVSGLSRATTYRVGVAAKSDAGTGALSARDVVKTKAHGKNVSATKKPSKVSKPTASVAKSRFRAKWKAASTEAALSVTSYQVRVTLHGKTVRTYTVDDRVRVKLVSHLKRHTAYKVTVRAGNWAGWGDWSSAKGVRTH